jgi:hypothetical protein
MLLMLLMLLLLPRHVERIGDSPWQAAPQLRHSSKNHHSSDKERKQQQQHIHERHSDI